MSNGLVAGSVSRSGLATGLAVTAVAAVTAFWLVPTHINLTTDSGTDIPPALVPLVCAAVVLLIGIALTAGALLGRGSGVPDPVEDAGGASVRQVAVDLAVWGASTVLVLLLMPRLGFVPTAALLLAGWLVFAGVRSPLVVLAVAAVVPTLLDWLCWHALKIQLP